MDISTFFETLSSAEGALLPSASALWLALHLGWAIVLAGGARWLARRVVPAYQLSLAWLTLLWCLLPGALSPAFWLGLAFQIPSTTTVIICLGWLLQRFGRTPASEASCAVADARSLGLLLVPGMVLGWVLLLDTLAWFPVSLYAWGFAAPAVVVAVVVAGFFWVQQGTRASALPLGVLALFVLARLPSGNLWDALLDPWLWLALQAGWLFSVARRFLPAATRA
jgi:hypothetical protein